jgi:hypothetical protein
VEEDDRDAQRQDELDAHGFERKLEHVQHVGAEEDARAEQEDHAREPEQAGDELGDQPPRGGPPGSR